MKPPWVDQRNKQKLIEQMKEMVPYYTPEWRFTPDDPDPGSTLFLLFADMYQGNIDRLNKVPLKYFIEFLNLLGVNQMPPQPAKSYITCTLAEGAETPVFLPKGTQISSEKQADDEEILFELEQDMLVTPASIKALYGIAGKNDRIAALPSHLYQLTADMERRAVKLVDYILLYDQQHHQFLIGHRDLFLVNGPARLMIRFAYEQDRQKEENILAILTDPSFVTWEYFTESGWKTFDEVSLMGQNVVLRKNDDVPWITSEQRGVVSRWLRCILQPGRMGEIKRKIGLLDVTDIRLSVDSLPVSDGRHIIPDQLFFNDIQLDPAGFAPFGEEFGPFSVFYFSCDEAFTKKQALITLRFKLSVVLHERKPEEPKINWKLIMKKSDFETPPPQKIMIHRVLWEYWNGQTWVPLPIDDRFERLFLRENTLEEEVSITFFCPEDMKPTYVNAEYRHWARIRVIAADNIQQQHYIWYCPWMSDIELSYQYTECDRPVEHVLTINNMEERDVSDAIIACNKVPIPLLEPLETDAVALYIGFERPPEKGPISMFFSIPFNNPLRDRPGEMYWQYLSGGTGTRRWVPLKVEDGTRSLSQSGVVRFLGPSGAFLREKRFGQELYWIRILLETPGDRGTLSESKVEFDGIFLNTSRIVQQESIQGEFPEQRWQMNSPIYQLSKAPVVSEEVWVDETGQISQEEIQRLEKEEPDALDIVRNSAGEVEQVWVRWKSVELFYQSRPTDRHYMIDRANGVIMFGDGFRGKEISREKKHAVKVNYKIVAGSKGNVPKGEIKNLQQMFAFVRSVYNPVPASGGCDLEPMEDTIRRGPMVLRHRNRAVTTEDFEWLAKQANANIAKVRCLPHMNANFEKSVGTMTVVVLPKGGYHDPAYFVELKRQVEQYLMERALNLIMFPHQLQVVLPVFLEISVYAELVVDGMENAVRIEAEAQEKLQRFLDPIKGNFDGNGWEIGEIVHATVFYSLLKSIRSVSHVEKLSMTVAKVVNQKRMEITKNEYEQLSYGIICSGKHNIAVVAQ